MDSIAGHYQVGSARVAHGWPSNKQPEEEIPETKRLCRVGFNGSIVGHNAMRRKAKQAIRSVAGSAIHFDREWHLVGQMGGRVRKDEPVYYGPLGCTTVSGRAAEHETHVSQSPKNTVPAFKLVHFGDDPSCYIRVSDSCFCVPERVGRDDGAYVKGASDVPGEEMVMLLVDYAPGRLSQSIVTTPMCSCTSCRDRLLCRCEAGKRPLARADVLRRP